MPSFEEELDEFLRGDNRNEPYNSIFVCDTPASMIMLGMSQLPIYITKHHLYNIMHEKDESNRHWHGLGRSDLLELPASLSSPAMIMDSLTSSGRGDGVVFLLNQTDTECLPIIAVIRPNGKSTYRFEVRESNHMLSAYGKEDIGHFVERAVKQDAILFVDKKQTEDLESQTQLELLQRLDGLPLNRIIHQSRAIVRTVGLEPRSLPMRTLSELATSADRPPTRGRGTGPAGRDAI